MDKNVVKDKIKKLLALAGNNPSDEESYSALAKAQELMAQYKIEEAEISDKDKVGCIKTRTSFSFSKSGSDGYLIELANLIADNFSCVSYLTKMHGSKSYHIMFMRLEYDVNVCIQAMTLANTAIVRGYNKVWYDIRDKHGLSSVPASIFNPAKVGYIDGYLNGLEEVFNEQKEQNQEWGLVLVAPQEATDYLTQLTGASVIGQNSLRCNDTYRDQGYNDGKQFNMNKQIDNK